MTSFWFCNSAIILAGLLDLTFSFASAVKENNLWLWILHQPSFTRENLQSIEEPVFSCPLSGVFKEEYTESGMIYNVPNNIGR
jgi:hypothetical protein